jgi:predicted esterase
MKKKPLQFLCLFLAFGLSLNLQAQQVFKTTSKSVIGYLEYVPKDYHSNSNRYPVVIFLHGVGERGPSSTDPKVLERDADELTKIGPPYHVKKGTQFPFILITPQLKGNYREWPTWYVREVIDHIKKRLRIDDKRIYLTGLSLGGGGVWTTAQESPEIFAAIAPVCGGYNSTSKAKGIAENKVAVWAFHGDKDNVVPLSRTANMVNAINLFNPNPKAKLSVYHGVRHDAWVKAYKPDHSEHSPNVYEWMLAQRRGTTSSDSDQNTVPNEVPVVSAGADLTVSTNQSKVELRGTANDPDGNVQKYQWKQTSGGEVKMEGAQSAKLIVSKYKEGSYTFRLTATDNEGASKYDEVKLIVTKDNSNKAPEVYAGKDKDITTKQTRVEFEAAASDPDGEIKKYYWKQIAGRELKIEGASSKKLVLSKFKEGKYEFRLTVTDNDGATTQDEVALVVKAEAASNKAPVVDLGSDRAIYSHNTSLELSGQVSDSDGSVKKYQWSQTYGSSVRMDNAQSQRVIISRYTVGHYTFRLTVTDDKGAYSYDEVRVEVKKDESKIVAYAGPDRVVRLPLKDYRLSGGADSPDKIVSYEWKQVGGSGVRLEDRKARTVKLSSIGSAGVRTFQLIVRDEKGRTAVDEIKINFLEAIASGNATPEEAMVVVDPEEVAEELTADEAVDFERWKDLIVTIYNERGERVFAGKWTAESTQELYRSSGLYVYHLQSPASGHRLKTGKVYIR